MLCRLSMRSFLLVILLIGFNHIATAQQFTATVSKNSVAVGERFQLTFTLSAEGSDFQAPDLTNFNVLQGPSYGNSVTSINERVSSSSTFSYVLTAKKVGNYRIKGARAKSGNKTFQAKSVGITVTKGATQKKATEDKNSLFIKSVLSKSTAYIGEPVVITHYLYTHLNIVQIDNLHSPSYNGFWTETIQRNEIPVSNEVINGRSYRKVELNKTILFPHKSGKLTIDAIDVEAVIRKVAQNRSNNIFNSFFGTRYEDNKIFTKGKPVSINILPLPSGAPESFNGNVGNYTYDLKVNKTDINANDAVNFTIKLKGTGNIKLLEAPVIEFPTDFEVYDPKINNKINVEENGINGHKTFEYLTIARQPGEFVFKPVEFTFFNPAKKKYISLKSDEITINVKKGEGDSASGSVYTSPNKKDVQFIGKDIRHIKSGGLNLSDNRTLFYGSTLFYSLLGGPLILFLSLIAYRRKTISDNENISLLKRKKAGKVAVQKLKKAKSFKDMQDDSSFYDELSNAMLGYLGDKFSISRSEMSKDAAISAFANSNIEQHVSDDFISIIDQCEMARYSSEESTSIVEDVYKKAVKSINDIEKQVK